MSWHIWAPEMHFLFGRWYVYFAAGERDDIWKIRPYVLECEGEDPYSDPWHELGPMLPAETDSFSFRAFSLDATVFDVNGKWYMVWAEKVGVGRMISNLYIAEMESANRLKTDQVLLTTPDYAWERHGFWVNEGPFALFHDGKLFLTYSASDTGIHYAVGMLTADIGSDLLDPLSWRKERLPVLGTDEALGIYGPGHNCFTVDEQGDTVMVFHARTEKEITGDPLYNPNRHAMLLRVRWGTDGKPVFSFNNM